MAGFLYLELIDASFSFDGVIGAFAMTNNLFIIALGLFQSYYAIVGNLLKRHVINVAVAFASVAFVLNTAYHGALGEAHCLILTTFVSLWNVYRTNFEVDKKVK